LCFSLLSSVVVAQQDFAANEAQRVQDLLFALGCIGNTKCGFSGFGATTKCNYQSGANFEMTCNPNGYLQYL
jgi:hypothetical protein